MRRIKTQKGYTVVELLIVTAVTGGLFISAALLIRGQVQRTEYRQDMQIVEQSIRNVVDNVNNGTFGEIAGYDGTNLSRMRIGMRFWFCADGASATYAFCPSGNNGNIMHVETVVSGPVDYLADNPIRIPNGLKFSHWRGISSTGILTPLTPPRQEFGTSILFYKPNGDAVTSLTDNVAGVQFYSRSGTTAKEPTTGPTADGDAETRLSKITGLEGGVILCFTDGSDRWGSIEFGSVVSGLNVILNLEDKTRCTS